MENFKEILPLLIPLFALQLGMQIYALVDLAKRKRVRYGNKLIWVLVIMFFNLIGPIVYFVLRGDAD